MRSAVRLVGFICAGASGGRSDGEEFGKGLERLADEEAAESEAVCSGCWGGGANGSEH